MKCLAPLSLPPSQAGGERNIVPCGKCESCLVLKRNQWTFRLTEEFHASKSAYFATLTYAPGNEPWTSSDRDTLSKADITTFMKKLRHHASKHKEGPKWPPIRFFCAGEYGELERPHYHVILFNVPLKTIDNLENIWNNGFVKVDTLNYARIHYTTKYVIQPKKKMKKITTDLNLSPKCHYAPESDFNIYSELANGTLTISIHMSLTKPEQNNLCPIITKKSYSQSVKDYNSKIKLYKKLLRKIENSLS